MATAHTFGSRGSRSGSDTPGSGTRNSSRIGEQAPLDEWPQLADRVAVGPALLGGAVGPVHRVDDARAGERRQDPRRGIVALVVVDRDLLEAEHPVMRDPFQQVRRFVAGRSYHPERRGARLVAVPAPPALAGRDRRDELRCR
jgi:hypothetical protein